MENGTKKKYTVDIAGNPLTIVSDEPETFVKTVSTKLSDKMKGLVKSSFRITQLDAALLCALDFLGEKLKADKKIRTLEAQMELYEANIKNLREELEKYRNAEAEKTESTDRVKTVSDALRSDEGNAGSEDKIKMLEKYLESKKSAGREGNSDNKTREEKIRYIESLLRGNENK